MNKLPKKATKGMVFSCVRSDGSVITVVCDRKTKISVHVYGDDIKAEGWVFDPDRHDT